MKYQCIGSHGKRPISYNILVLPVTVQTALLCAVPQPVALRHLCSDPSLSSHYRILVSADCKIQTRYIVDLLADITFLYHF